jgi:hypothetical protein
MGFSTSENVKWPYIFHIVGKKGSSFDFRVSEEENIFEAFILLIWIMKYNQNFFKS